MKTNMKMMTAALGAGALLAMGGVTIATSSADPETTTPAPGPVQTGVITTTETTIAPTVVETPGLETPTTSSAVPEITGPAPLPSEDQGLPG